MGHFWCEGKQERKQEMFEVVQPHYPYFRIWYLLLINHIMCNNRPPMIDFGLLYPRIGYDAVALRFYVSESLQVFVSNGYNCYSQ